jgi:thiol:disulfide interchange protein DsbC
MNRASYIIFGEKERIMKKLVCLFVGLFILGLPFSAHAFKMKEGQDCLKCHKLKKAEAQDIIDRAVPNGKVVDIKEGPVKGVWQIDVQRGEQRGGVLLDFSKKYLVGLQPIPKKVSFSKIPLADAVVLGLGTAKKKVIVFTDPDCPYCRELHPIMKRIVEKHSDVAFYVILNPLPMHKDAYKKAQAILCTKSIEMLDDAFSGKTVPEPTCPADAVERTTALAKSLDFNGTPMLVRQDGLVLQGFLPEDKLVEWINAAK